MTDTDPEDIKAAIRKKGISMARLADTAGLSPQLLSLTMRAAVSERAEQVIAEFLEMHPMKIWPSRYRRDGSRIKLKTRKRVAA